MINKLRVLIKLIWRKYSTDVPSFCKCCGIRIRDFSVPDLVWNKIEHLIPHDGNTLCYNCFSDYCGKVGLPRNWDLISRDLIIRKEAINEK